MKFSARPLVLLTVFALVPWVHPSRAEEPSATAAAHLGDKLVIETSSAPVFLGKATMTVSPLRHHDGVYSGNYQMDVSPLSLANEKGNLSVTFSDDAVRKLGQRAQVSFHGEATNSDGKRRTIDGQAKPTAGDRGDITLKIISEREKLVFHTTYRFVAN